MAFWDRFKKRPPRGEPQPDDDAPPTMEELMAHVRWIPADENPFGVEILDCWYAHRGETRDGPLFKAEVMEDKWDIYLYDGFLYFVRSWSGILEYRATIRFDETGARVVAVQAGADSIENEPDYPIRVVDFLIRSHLYRLQIPHPFPRKVDRDPGPPVMFSFALYGAQALYGTFADTTKLRPPLDG